MTSPVERFFAKFPEFQKAPRHPKWKEANLAARLPGWNRLQAATNWPDGVGTRRAEDAATTPGNGE